RQQFAGSGHSSTACQLVQWDQHRRFLSSESVRFSPATKASAALRDTRNPTASYRSPAGCTHNETDLLGDMALLPAYLTSGCSISRFTLAEDTEAAKS